MIAAERRLSQASDVLADVRVGLGLSGGGVSARAVAVFGPVFEHGRGAVCRLGAQANRGRPARRRGHIRMTVGVAMGGTSVEGLASLLECVGDRGSR